MAIKAQKELTGMQSQLLKAKDEELKANLATQDAHIAEARGRAASAELQTEELKEQNLATEKNLEAERLARVEIEERVAWRRILEIVRRKVTDRLKPFKGQTVSLWFHAGDHESRTFAFDIAAVLNAAQWEVFAPATLISMAGAGRRDMSPPDEGVMVVSTHDSAATRASEAIVRELTALGFDARKSAKPEDRAGSVVIVNVEARPQGPQGEAKLRRALAK